MPKYFVFNPGPNVAVELKPGFGEFRIGPGKRIEVPSRELAQSLVTDSAGHLQLQVVEETVKVGVIGGGKGTPVAPKVLGGVKPLNSTKPPEKEEVKDGEHKDNQ